MPPRPFRPRFTRARFLANAILGIFFATFLGTLAPLQALAWPAPTNAPAGWTTSWVQSSRSTSLYSASSGTTVLAFPDPQTPFRVDAPAVNDRYWVLDPVTNGWGWVPQADTTPLSTEPSQQAVLTLQEAHNLSPHDYLYQHWPDTATRMDCVIRYESSWNPLATSPAGMEGLAQFDPSTWQRTPQGQAGRSAYDPYASIDAMGWVIHGNGSWSAWTPTLNGDC